MTKIFIRQNWWQIFPIIYLFTHSNSFPVASFPVNSLIPYSQCLYPTSFHILFMPGSLRSTLLDSLPVTLPGSLPLLFHSPFLHTCPIHNNSHHLTPIPWLCTWLCPRPSSPCLSAMEWPQCNVLRQWAPFPFFPFPFPLHILIFHNWTHAPFLYIYIPHSLPFPFTHSLALSLVLSQAFLPFSSPSPPL